MIWYDGLIKLRGVMVGLKPQLFLPHNCCLRDGHFFVQGGAMSVAPAHHARDSDSNFSPDIEAELFQVALMPCAIARAQHVQRMIDIRCATCRRSCTMVMSHPPPLTIPQLYPYLSRLPLFRCDTCLACSALVLSCRA